jgi:hypothetical protein
VCVCVCVCVVVVLLLLFIVVLCVFEVCAVHTRIFLVAFGYIKYISCRINFRMYGEGEQNPSQASVVEGAQDNFRAVEKAIRRLFAELASCQDPRWFRKRSKSSTNSEDRKFSLDRLVDPWAPDHRLRCISCADNVFTLESPAPSGLYVITRGLNETEQLHWAKSALLRYSCSEHTNVSNLKRLREEQARTSDLAGKSTPGDLTSRRSHDVVSEESLWLKSINDDDDFLAFREMRWCCNIRRHLVL